MVLTPCLTTIPLGAVMATSLTSSVTPSALSGTLNAWKLPYVESVVMNPFLTVRFAPLFNLKRPAAPLVTPVDTFIVLLFKSTVRFLLNSMKAVVISTSFQSVIVAPSAAFSTASASVSYIAPLSSVKAYLFEKITYVLKCLGLYFR